MQLLYKFRFYLSNKHPHLYDFARNSVEPFIKYKGRERSVSFGELNPDSTFYLIRFRRQKLGLMALYINVLLRIDEGLRRGLIPIVDLQNYPNAYLDEDQLHKSNAWESYFCQPFEYQLEDVYSSKNVVLSNMETPLLGSPREFWESNLSSSNAFRWYDEAHKYMPLNESINKYIEEQYQQLFAGRGKVLGIVSRGTDLIGFNGHSVQPSVQSLADKANFLVNELGYDSVYIASDSDVALKELAERIVVPTFSFSQRRFDDFASSNVSVLSDFHFNRENDSFLKGKEYLAVVELLAKCNGLMGSLVGATVGAILINGGKYDHVEIIDEGVYESSIR